ncbi:conserved Plasmodium protein, unknown function [Plasmodium ovale curtisi]|uniref:ATPase AAA-type core domain-containing protein n=1 Tax=Plasmodium ovale curtisi TaxID=864141 RepID=A0A1A8W0N3_PLAOA|nr:conserved Plasmodium protein, unknown function [Plasmodium ovale curtisi]
MLHDVPIISLMENAKKRNDSTGDIFNLIELLKNEENIFACVECCENNSYETYDNILTYVKSDLNIHVCVLDIISIYKCKNVAKFVKDLFIDFTKYVRRKRIYKSAFFLPYFNDWVMPIKEHKSAIIHQQNGKKEDWSSESSRRYHMTGRDSDNFLLSTEGKRKRKYEVNMHIYNAIFYLKNNLLKKMNKKYKVNLIGFHKTRGVFDSYRNLFDYNIKVFHFVSTHILYYIHMNRNITLFYKKGKLSLDVIYDTISNKLDFVSSHDRENINLFKCFFKYYYKFQNCTNRKGVGNRQNGTSKNESTNIRDGHNNLILHHNFKLVNFLIHLKNFKYLRKYKYFKRETKKNKSNTFLLPYKDNILEYIKRNFYTPFFIREYVRTLLKRHVKRMRNFIRTEDSLNYSSIKNGISGESTNNRDNIVGSTKHGNHPCLSDDNRCGNKRDDRCENEGRTLSGIRSCDRRKLINSEKPSIGEKHEKVDELVVIRKHFFLKKKYQNDHYNVYNSEAESYIRFYFSKFHLPNSLLIYGKDGSGKTTLLRFIALIICSNYKDIHFARNSKYNVRFDTGTEKITYTGKSSNQSVTIGRCAYNGCSGSCHRYLGNCDSCRMRSARVINMHHGEKKKIYSMFRNVCIIPFENHLLVNKTIGENSRYIKRIFTTAFKNQPSVIIFDNIDTFVEKNNNYKYSEDDQNEDVYKNIYLLLTHYLRLYVNGSNRIKFIATSSVHPQYFKFSFLYLVEKILFIS